MYEFALEDAAREQLKFFYHEGKSVVQLLAFFLIALALFIAVVRLGKIAQVMKDFLAARGPIWEFQKTVADLKEIEPSIRNLSDPVSLLAEKIDAAQKQIAELQRHSIRERTPEVEQDGQASGLPIPLPARNLPEHDKNWELLREYWSRNTDRIEAVIDGIVDGRKRLKYDRLPRYAYKPIIEQLAKDGRINQASAKASLELLDIFNQYRPRNRTVPDEVVGGLQVLDRQLETELVLLPQRQEPSNTEIRTQTPKDDSSSSHDEELRIGS